MRKQYDKEFKMHAAKLVVETEKPVAQVARELDLAEQTLHNWVRKFKDDQDGGRFIGSGNSAPEDGALRDLQKKLRDLEEENAILKKAMGIFAKNQK
jgi:transposase